MKVIGKKYIRAGSVMIRINKKFYEVPDSFLFKSHDNKDIYLVGVRKDNENSFKPKYISTVKFIEDDIYEHVPYDLLESFMIKKHKKLIIDNEEYDIPIEIIDDIKLKLMNLSKYDLKNLKQIKNECSIYLFNK
jgi:hypothetical protein